MANKLKIYACSGIGAVNGSNNGYWRDDTDTVQNTQAVNTLLARINYNYAMANRLQGVTKAQRIQLLNEIDWLLVALDAAKRFKTNDQKLYRAGQVICSMIMHGDFDLDTVNADKHADNVEAMIDRANEAYKDDTPVADTDRQFMEDWGNQIVVRNKVGLDAASRRDVSAVIKATAPKIRKQVEQLKKIKGIGEVDESWSQNEDLAEYLNNGGKYFIYLYFTDDQLKRLPAVFKSKRLKQRRIYNYCKQLFVDVYGSEDDMQLIIRQSIIENTGHTAEEMCQEIATTGKQPEGIGFTFLGVGGALAVKYFLAFLGVLAGLIVGIITAICEMVARSNVAKYGAIDRAAVEAACPDTSDYEGLNFGRLTTAGFSGWLPVLIIGGAALYAWMKKN